jgi:hypothetical protein
MKQNILYTKHSSVARKKSNYDLETHINTPKHKKQIQSFHNAPKVNGFYIKQN